MLIQHFVRGLNDHISGSFHLLESKTMEVVVERVRLTKENLTFSLGCVLGVQTVSAAVSGSVV